MQKQIILLMIGMLGVFSQVKAQDMYARFQAEVPNMVQELTLQKTQSTNQALKKNIDAKLVALGVNEVNNSSLNPIEIEIARGELFRDFYAKMGDAATAAKYDSAIKAAQQKLIEQK